MSLSGPSLGGRRMKASGRYGYAEEGESASAPRVCGFPPARLPHQGAVTAHPLGKSCMLRAFTERAVTVGLTRPQQIDIDAIEAYHGFLFRYRQPNSQKPLEKATIRNRLTAVKVLFRRKRSTNPAQLIICKLR